MPLRHLRLRRHLLQQDRKGFQAKLLFREGFAEGLWLLPLLRRRLRLLLQRRVQLRQLRL